MKNALIFIYQVYQLVGWKIQWHSLITNNSVKFINLKNINILPINQFIPHIQNNEETDPDQRISIFFIRDQ